MTMAVAKLLVLVTFERICFGCGLLLCAILVGLLKPEATHTVVCSGRWLPKRIFACDLRERRKKNNSHGRS